MNAAFINTFATLLLIILYSIPMISLKEEPDLTENESTRGQEDGEIDIDEAGGYFDLLEGEELPFSKRSFAINFLNRQQDYAVVEPKEGCARGTELFVFVPSRPQAFYLRQKIRESWASNLTDQRIELRFVVGWSSFQEDFDLLLQEFLHLDDLILYDIDDTYANLYMKIYVALQWQQFYCPSVPFVLKTDDDTVVDLGRLRWWIDNDFSRRTAQYSAAVFGGLWRGARPIRSQGHKWFVSRQDFSASTYPAYMNGPSYLLTGRAVSVILNATADVKAIPIEDILYTGILANRAHLRKFSIWQHFRRGKYIYVNERCKVDKASGRRVPYVTAIYGLSDPDKLQRAYDQLHRINCTAWSSAIGSIWNSLFTE